MTASEAKTSWQRSHCPRCDGARVCDVHGALDVPWSSDDGERGSTDHRPLRCRGCETVFYWQSSWNTYSSIVRYNQLIGEEEEVPVFSIETYPPPPKHTRPDWSWSLNKTDEILAQIMGETYTAAEAESYVLASVGLRTALDRITELLGIDSSLPMVGKVGALRSGGWIGETEALTLDTVAEAGNAAAHRGWSPDEHDFRILLSTLEQFIQRALLSGRAALSVAPKVPPKQRRTKS